MFRSCYGVVVIPRRLQVEVPGEREELIVRKGRFLGDRGRCRRGFSNRWGGRIWAMNAKSTAFDLQRRIVGHRLERFCIDSIKVA
jgi:hypothetical protein